MYFELFKLAYSTQLILTLLYLIFFSQKYVIDIYLIYNKLIIACIACFEFTRVNIFPKPTIFLKKQYIYNFIDNSQSKNVA